MASVKKYIAKKGISFDGLKPPARVEAGKPLPDSIPQEMIDELLRDGAVEEVKEVKPKAEAKK